MPMFSTDSMKITTQLPPRNSALEQAAPAPTKRFSQKIGGAVG